jgi:hypothetical protein
MSYWYDLSDSELVQRLMHRGLDTELARCVVQSARRSHLSTSELACRYIDELLNE